MSEPAATPPPCICDWPGHCSGTYVLECDGCGGDQCVCACGGERDCSGCEACLGSDEGL